MAYLDILEAEEFIVNVFMQFAFKAFAVCRELDILVKLSPLGLQLLVYKLANFAKVTDHSRSYRLSNTHFLGCVLTARCDQIHKS